MNKTKIDIHCHSNCSDGLFSPEELVKYAKSLGINQLSITDHDTISGQEAALKRSMENEIVYMPGLELTTTYMGKSLHLLCYGFDIEKANSNKKLKQYFEKTRKSDLDWVYEICKKSKEDPIVLKKEDEEIKVCLNEEDFDKYPGTIFTYFHPALILSDKFKSISRELGEIPPRYLLYSFFGKMEEDGKYESYGIEYKNRYNEVYEKYKINTKPDIRDLENDGVELEKLEFGKLIKPYWWIKRNAEHYLEISEAIDLAKEIGACPVLAHPLEQGLDEDDLRTIARMGLEGVEVFTYKQNDQYAEYLSKLCDELKLLKTGGSDFHDPHHRSKVSLGNYRVDKEINCINMQDFIDRGYKVYMPKA